MTQSHTLFSMHITSHHNNSGGALIAPSVVLFAAHCLDYKDQQVNIGSYKKYSADFGAQPAFCNEWIDDPTFFSNDFGDPTNDFALCLLDKEVIVDTTSVKLILNTDSNVPASSNDDLVVMGLGHLAEGYVSRKFFNRRIVVVCECVCVHSYSYSYSISYIV
jgi:hypothetical protein